MRNYILQNCRNLRWIDVFDQLAYGKGAAPDVLIYVIQHTLEEEEDLFTLSRIRNVQCKDRFKRQVNGIKNWWCVKADTI